MARLTNWAGNVRFRATTVHRPTSLEELQEIVASSARLRVIGSGHSFSAIADTPGALVSVEELPKVIEVDRHRWRATVSAGVRYAELAAELERKGCALANLASLPHISVAGALATATHGSGVSNGNLATAVAGLELVRADGERITLSRDEDRPEFDGAVVSLGALGVVTSVELEIEPSYVVRQVVYERLPLDQLRAHFSSIAAAAYSVSLFTTWRSTAIDQVWLKQRLVPDGAEVAPRHFFGATIADGPRHPIPGMATSHCTAQMGLAGPWNDRLPHFRAEHTPSAGNELQSEYLVGREHALEAIAAIEEIRAVVAPLVYVSEIRTVAADELWLSPSYHRDTVAFHFTWVKDVEAVAAVLPSVEAALQPFLARPHWGKVFRTDADRVRSLYERADDFVALLFCHDPTGKFRNDFVDRYFPATSSPATESPATETPVTESP